MGLSNIRNNQCFAVLVNILINFFRYFFKAVHADPTLVFG